MGVMELAALEDLHKGAFRYRKIGVKVGNEDASLFLSDKSVMLEKADGDVVGVALDAIEAITISGDAVNIAYLDGPVVKSLKISPWEDASALLLLKPGSDESARTAFDRLFEEQRAEMLEQIDEIAKKTWKRETEDEWKQRNFRLNLIYGLAEKLHGEQNVMTLKAYGKLPKPAGADFVKAIYLEFLHSVIHGATGFHPTRHFAKPYDCMMYDDTKYFWSNHEGMSPREIDQFCVSSGAAKEPLPGAVLQMITEPLVDTDYLEADETEKVPQTSGTGT